MTFVEMVCLLAAFTAILMIGSTHLASNIQMWSLQTSLLALVTALLAHDSLDLCLALGLFTVKALGISWFLLTIIKKVDVQRDAGTIVRSPIAMHISIGFLAVSYILASQLPVPAEGGSGWPGATAGISLVCSGLVLMLTRRIALSQIVGFLVMENGIFLFGLTQTHGMPILIETGVLLDVLAGVMVAGLIAFRIKKNFEHIDVSMLSELKEGW
ncbi:MAG TPA: hypothetical protein V6C81_00335 [Planktothrix sp.]|jgi:hydrogenase-4 component E